MKKNAAYLLPMLLLSLYLSGCSMTRLAARQTAAIMLRALPVYERETNVQFAEQSIAGNLKMMEALLEVTPDDPELLLLTARAYTVYTFGFVEERIEIAEKNGHYEQKQLLQKQAADFYSRANRYSLRAMGRLQKDFPAALEGDAETLTPVLDRCDTKHVAPLFWTAYTWGNMINLRQTDPAALANLPKVELIMQRVLELDERYYFGGPHLFFGVYYGGRPVMFGGNPEKAHYHLKRAVEITNGRFLLAKFLLAKYYAVPAQDRETYVTTLEEIISAPEDLYPEQSLANQIAKRSAKRWLEYADELFFELNQ